MSIIIATAAAIGGTGPLTSAADAAKALEPVAGAAAKTLFAIGLLGASLLAAAVVPLATSYALAEAVGVERSVSRRFRDAKLFLGLFTAQIVVGAGIALCPREPHRPAAEHAVPQRADHADPARRSSSCSPTAAASWAPTPTRPGFRVLATVCTVGVALLAVVVTAQTVLSWAG